MIAGSSGWHDPFLVELLLAGAATMADRAGEDLLLIIDDAPKGVDPIVSAVARQREYQIVRERTHWERGESAGGERNRRALAKHKPDLVFALYGKGKATQTEDLVERAQLAGVPVYELESA